MKKIILIILIIKKEIKAKKIKIIRNIYFLMIKLIKI